MTTAGSSFLETSSARDPQRPARPRLPAMVRQDLRWAFSRPYSWMIGIGVNLVLSLGYLVWFPLTGQKHRDWAILIGTYFAVFVLADVTTTNVLGVDTERTRLRLMRGVPLFEVLLVKNLALLVIVGLPTLVATGVITAAIEPEYKLVLTLPGVLYPVLTWLGVGNLVSVVLPYSPLPLSVRWRRRRTLTTTVYWLVCLGFPYALCVAIDPLARAPRMLTRVLGLPPTDLDRGILLLTMGLLAWGIGTGAALLVAHRRKIRFDDLR